MNDRKFIELLNLYLDGEIDPPDAAALEHEIQYRPDRHRLYQDYCRLHRATQIVCERFRMPGALEDLPMGRGRRRAGLMHRAQQVLPWAAAIAACATAAFVFVQRNQPSGALGGSDTAPATTVIASDTPAVTRTNVTTGTGATGVQSIVSYSAPMASTRLDPYVLEFPDEPFVLRQDLDQPVWNVSQPASPFTPVSLQMQSVDEGMAPTSLDFFFPSTIGSESPTGPQIFRGRSDGQAATFQPLGLEIQR